MTGAGSRVVGRGRLLRSLRHLQRRVEKYGTHRARTPAESGWALTLADRLDRVLAEALTPPAHAALDAADRRATRIQKRRPHV